MLEALGCAVGTLARMPAEAAVDELPEEFLEFIADWESEDFEDEGGVDEAPVATPPRPIERTLPARAERAR